MKRYGVLSVCAMLMACQAEQVVGLLLAEGGQMSTAPVSAEGQGRARAWE